VELLKENVEEHLDESPGNKEEETIAEVQEMDCSTLR